jgi:NADH:ubiquinone oxidoreductase subunit E
MTEAALHTLAMHDELVARMAAQREALVYEVERAQRLDTWVTSKAVAA